MATTSRAPEPAAAARLSGEPGPAASPGRATVLVASAACAFASIPIFVTLALRSGSPLVDVLVGRYVLAGVLLSIIAWFTGQRTWPADALRVAAVVGLMQAAIAYTSLLALSYIPAGTISFLFYTYPGWIALIARIRHSEPLTPARLLALGLSLAGVLIMVGSPASAKLNFIGVGLALASALLYAVYVPLLARIQQHMTPAMTAACMSGGAGIVFYVVKLTSGSPAVQFTRSGVVAVVGTGILSTTIAFLLFLRGLRVLGPVRTGIVSTIEPFVTALLAAAVIAQPLAAATVVGGVFIAAAVVLLQLRG